MKQYVVFVEANDGGWLVEARNENGSQFSMVGPLPVLVARVFGIRQGPELKALTGELQRLRRKRKWRDHISSLWRKRAEKDTGKATL